MQKSITPFCSFGILLIFVKMIFLQFRANMEVGSK